MDFQLTDEQRELRDTARRYARSRLLDVAKECEERGEPPSHDLVDASLRYDGDSNRLARMRAKKFR